MRDAPERFTVFARGDSVFSQRYPDAPLVPGGQRFATAERFMMLRKAE